tara:strand:+ start:25201 stop:25953 length:753 start_codon:yes stop_codon:yes gene_type:complete
VSLNANGLLRNSRHLLLNDFDEEKISSLVNSKVLIVGVGGLGCPAAQYLAASGISNFRLVDFDKVEESNLPRQILYGPLDVGKYKVEVGKRILKNINPAVNVIAETAKADSENLPYWIEWSDLVLDCTDGFQTKHLLNQLCVRQKIPLIIGSAIQWEGQLFVVHPKESEFACYECIFPISSGAEDASCGAFGVLSTAVGTIGIFQANETIKILTGTRVVKNQLILFDARSLSVQIIKVIKRSGCSVCDFT